VTERNGCCAPEGGDPGERGTEARAAAEAVARRSYGKLVAMLAARTRDVAAAEDALSEAFTSALTVWPRSGCPSNPEAWLMTAARRRAIDMARGRRRDEAAAKQLRYLTERMEATAESGTTVPDQRLALMFACAHPAIEEGIRAPLMLQTVLGLSGETIAAAFLTSPAAMSKRLVRAKEKIRRAGIPFREPEREDLRGRLDSVLDAIYAAFMEGWSDGGAEVRGRELAGEAIYLARIVIELLPAEPEALGLLALMLHAEARRRARRNEAGEYVPFSDQDTELWDWATIEEAERLLRRASALGSIGRYQIEGALQSAHVYRRQTGEANWGEVVHLYDALLELTGGSPVVAINRAPAVAELRGAGAGREALEAVSGDARVRGYQSYWAARAELLRRAGERDEARKSYEMAIGLERDAAVRRFLLRRQAELEG
jgi:predicted RNA polymerase sigma factor